MHDPVTALLKAANMSLAEFRARFKYSKQFLVDVTAATYTRLPDSVHAALRELSEEKGLPVGQVLLDNFGATTLDAAYENYQHVCRGLVGNKFRGARPIQQTPALSPAHFFVKATSGSPTRFSKDLKVPPQQVRRWVSGQTKTMPESIELALREVAYPYMRELIEVQAAWVQEHAS